MALWIYGDSYADGYIGKPWSWSNTIARTLDLNIHNHGISGTGLESMYGLFQTYMSGYQKDDVLIFCLTQFHRQNFIPGYPQISIAPSLDNVFITPPDIKKKYKKAFQLFTDVLYSEANAKINFTNFLFCLEHLATSKGVKIICLPCFSDVQEFLTTTQYQFPSIYFANGNLFSISENECIQQETTKFFYDFEARANHMCKRNHLVLADKILAHIHSNNDINLTTGFHKQFVSKEQALDISFANEEFLHTDKMKELEKSKKFDIFVKKFTSKV